MDSSSPSSNNNTGPEKNLVVSVERINRDVINVSEDSGCSSISDGSVNSETTVIMLSDESEPTTATMNDINEEKKSNEMNPEDQPIIGNDVTLFEAEFVTEELGDSKKRTSNKELLEEKRLAREAHEKEIQEKQYKRLMHLLTQSKAFSNFISTKFSNKLDHKNDNMNRKRKKNSPNHNSSPVKKEKLNTKFNSETKEVYKNNTKLNLNKEKIAEELEAMSDDESENKENIESDDDSENLKFFEGQLRDYQKVGLKWLKVLYENGLNGILADEMGLGKTIQIIALLACLIEKHVRGPFLIIVPLSTLPNWISEFQRFAPKIPVVVCYKNMDQKDILRTKISKKHLMPQTYSTQPVVLTTYQHAILKSCTHLLSLFHWSYIIVDEAQRIKNNCSQLFKTIKGFESVNRVLLTGTPLQNNLAELWSLLNFLLPDIFDDLDVFQSWFNAKQVQEESGKKKLFKQEEEKQVLSTLREILSPFILRRLKEDVCPDIPLLKEIIIYAPLTQLQYDLYSALLNKQLNRKYDNSSEVAIIDIDGVRPKRRCTQKFDYSIVASGKKTDESKSAGQIEFTSFLQQQEMEMWNKFIKVTDENIGYLSKMKTSNYTMIYRHIINHPYIIHNPINHIGSEKYYENIIKVSGKLLVLEPMLKFLKRHHHKVLLFSTMTSVLDIIEEFLYTTDYVYVRLDGQIDYKNRKTNIEKFNTDPEVFLFLLTTKAGGVGLNLTAADTVIIYDSDWNPQNDIQAMSRCHRIGQSKRVACYRLCTKGTIDEEIIKRSSAKRFLEKAVISKEESIATTEESLLQLKKLLDNETFKLSDAKNKVYTEAELNRLLDRKDW